VVEASGGHPDETVLIMRLRQLTDAVFSLESCFNDTVSVGLALVPEGSTSNGGLSLYALHDCSLSRRGANTRKAQGLPPSSLHGGET
jgi:hypothetical protein